MLSRKAWASDSETEGVGGGEIADNKHNISTCAGAYRARHTGPRAPVGCEEKPTPATCLYHRKNEKKLTAMNPLTRGRNHTRFSPSSPGGTNTVCSVSSRGCWPAAAGENKAHRCSNTSQYKIKKIPRGARGESYGGCCSKACVKVVEKTRIRHGRRRLPGFKQG